MRVELVTQGASDVLGHVRRIGRVDVGQPVDGVVELGFLEGRFGKGRIIHTVHYPRPLRQERALFPIRDVNPTRTLPIISIAIIVANLLVWFLWQPQTTDADAVEFAYERAAIACELTTGEALSPSEIDTGMCRNDGAAGLFEDKNVWLAAVVSMFLHGGLFHLVSNMWFLWIFGNNVEEAFGRIPFLALYFATGLLATATFVVLNPDSTIPLVGASGAIAGVLGAYLVLFPTHRILSLFTVFFVPVPAVIFLGIWFFSQFGLQGEGVAWQAHAGGFIAGVLITLPLRSLLLRRVRQLHQPQSVMFGFR